MGFTPLSLRPLPLSPSREENKYPWSLTVCFYVISLRGMVMHKFCFYSFNYGFKSHLWSWIFFLPKNISVLYLHLWNIPFFHCTVLIKATYKDLVIICWVLKVSLSNRLSSHILSFNLVQIFQKVDIVPFVASAEV